MEAKGRYVILPATDLTVSSLRKTVCVKVLYKLYTFYRNVKHCYYSLKMLASIDDFCLNQLFTVMVEK